MDTAAEQVRTFLRRSEAARRARTDARVAALRAALPRAVQILRQHGARRVWLFGSLVWGPAHEGSDLDLAVDRLDPGRYFDAYEALWALVGEPVDLVTLDRAAESLRARVLADGEEVTP